MLPEDLGPAETAILFTDQFVDAGVAKLDALFGAEYARQHPQALGAYLAACTGALNAFMTAATALPDDGGDIEDVVKALSAFAAPPPVKGRRR